MKRIIISLMLLMVFLMSTSAVSAATKYKLPSEITWKYKYNNIYYDDEGNIADNWTSWSSEKAKYKYDKKKNLTKRSYKYHPITYKNKYKKGKRIKTVVNDDGFKITALFNKKGKMIKYGDAKFKYNKRGFQTEMILKRPWSSYGNKKRETWSYKYNGKKLKSAVHKHYDDQGKITYEGVETISFNGKGLPKKIVMEDPVYNENWYMTIEYKYKKGLVNKVTTTRYTYRDVYGDNDEIVGRVAVPEYVDQYVYKYTKKKTSLFRYNMMIMRTSSIAWANDNPYNGPGIWF